MTKILVVDDELLVRVGIKSSIDWENNRFEIVGEASNGEEALAILRQKIVDIVLLDINMPLMNGLKVLEVINKEKINTKVIILSCHEDFKYAQQALKLGAIDYVLKLSINSEKLLSMLLKAQKSLMFNSNKIVNFSFNQEWNKILNGKKQFDLDSLQKSGSKLISKKGIVTIFTVPIVHEEISDKNTIDRRLFTQSVSNLLSEIINDYGFGDIFTKGEREFVAVFNMEKDSKNNLEAMIEDINNAFKRYMKLSLFVTHSFPSVLLDDVLSIYNKLFVLQDRRFILGPKKTICLSLDKNIDFPHSKLLFNNEMENEIEISIEYGNDVQAFNTLMAYFNRVTKNIESFNRSKFNRDINEILHIYSKELKLYNQQFQDIDGYGSIITERSELTNCMHIYDTIIWFEVFNSLYFKHLAELRRNSVSRNIDQCINYIHSHFNEDLNVKDLAKQLYVSANYFGTLFKKKMGVSLKHYITEYRMKVAKELLRTTNKTITEISEDIGYENVFYFSTVFKKEFKMSPNVYRKKLLNS